MADNEISGTENANGVPQLRPCPFCGGEARLYPSEAGFFVGCFNDGCVINPCSGEFVYDGVWDEEQKEAAIKEWNTRAVEVVRCRDCESWCGPCEIRPDGIEGVCDGWSATGNVVLTREDDFCSYGARREEER